MGIASLLALPKRPQKRLSYIQLQQNRHPTTGQMPATTRLPFRREHQRGQPRSCYGGLIVELSEKLYEA